MPADQQLDGLSLCRALGINAEQVARVVITIDLKRQPAQVGSAFTPEQRGALAQELGIDPLYLYQVLTGRREMEPKAAVRLEQRSDGRLRRWHLRAHTWHQVWPELIGAEGAPPVPAQSQEVSNAE